MKDRDTHDAAASDVEATKRYVMSDLKAVYDDIVRDDSRGIGGYLWKFPSEGSNNSQEQQSTRRLLPPPAPSSSSLRNNWDKIYASTVSDQDVYPRKCDLCHVCWVSSRDDEVDHVRDCKSSKTTSSSPSSAHSADNLVSKLGTARRVWCEIDSALTRLQWRAEISALQNPSVDMIPFVDILEVTTPDQPPCSFQIVTRDSRRIVFQHRPECSENEQHGEAQDMGTKMIDAEQWCEYLDVFSQYASQQATKTNQPSSPEKVDDQQTMETIVLAQITRAILSGDEQTLKEILESGDKSWLRSLTDESGSSLLIIAFKLGAGQNIINMLLSAGVDCNDKNQDIFGLSHVNRDESLLLLVAASGDIDIMRILLAADYIEIDQRCALGATAFHAAANAGDVQIMELLCDAGASPSTTDANGWTAIHYAAACPTGVDALHFLCELVPELIDAQCCEGNTPLHVASGYGCVENVRALLETAANPHLQNSSGLNAYHVALYNHKIPCAVAINDYLNSSSRLDYNFTARKSNDELETTELQPLVSSVIGKTDAISAPAIVDDVIHESAWIQLVTDDGLPYFYNSVTGESTWHKPSEGTYQQAYIFGDTWSGEQSEDLFGLDREHMDGAQSLPLCMVPMVSLLNSLDDPMAASKLDFKWRKLRQKRRQQVMKHRQRYHMTSHQASEMTRDTVRPVNLDL